MNKYIRTDIAAEVIKARGRTYDGVCKVSEITLTAAQAARYGKGEGRYVTLETDAIEGYSEYDKVRLARAVKRELVKMLKASSRVLVVGLGNEKLTADALGAAVCERLEVGESLKALERLVEKAGGKIVGKMAILAEGAAAERDDLIYLERIPLFVK